MTVTRCKHLVYFPLSPQDVSSVPFSYGVQRAIPSARACFASPSPLVLTSDGLRNVDRMSIDVGMSVAS